MPEAALDFHGAGLIVEAPDAGLIETLLSAYARFAGAPDPGRAFRLAIEEDERARVPDLPEVWRGRLPEGSEGRIFEGGTVRAIEIVGHGHVSIDTGRGRARIVSHPGSLATLAFTPLVNVLDAALSASGQQMVHGACLGNRDGGILICAPSGAGKTTSALALARAGFAFASDDASVIRPCDGGYHVWGFRNRVKVHRRTLELLPWLGPLPDRWNDEDEQALDLAALAGVAEGGDESWPLQAVFLLGERTDGAHRVQPMARAEALVRLARDNVPGGSGGVTPWSQQQFARFAEVVRATPVFAVRAGPDLGSLNDALVAAMDRAAVP